MYNTTCHGGPDATDPAAIDWDLRRRRAVIGFSLDANGLPVNPIQPDLPEGRGELWHWGEAAASDAVVTLIDADGRRWLLVIERDDDYGVGVPGGGLEPDETPEAAVVRELWEETNLDLTEAAFTRQRARYVPDPRAGRNAWMVTVPFTAVLHTSTFPEVEGRDDARQALWLRADTYADFAAAVSARGEHVFPAHVDMLRDLLS
ncbi:NUDIX domain-containing protein [Glycomyces sp. MUSA5-2]|uniref:NUDIX domain-containing protein n=1 Tax=Glycomyces sp. MUSA5-2 TaxID=2053002 RepID=UPI0030081E9C